MKPVGEVLEPLVLRRVVVPVQGIKHPRKFQVPVGARPGVQELAFKLDPQVVDFPLPRP